MGMFDYVDFSCECPKCKNLVTQFQSKDDRCLMITIKPWAVGNFYAICVHCDCWVNFSYNREASKWEMTYKERYNSNYKAVENPPFIPHSAQDERFWNNRESAKKVLESLGLKLEGFNPSWLAFNTTNEQQHVQLPDVVIGRVAKFMKLPWEFEMGDEALKDAIKKLEAAIKDESSDLERAFEWKESSSNKLNIELADQSIFFIEEQLKKSRAHLAQLQAERALRWPSRK